MTDQTHPLEQSRAFGGVVDILEAIGATYAIWGGLAVVAHGEPRFTMDMDVLLSHRGFALDLFVHRLQETHYHADRVAVQHAITETLGQMKVDTFGTSDFARLAGKSKSVSTKIGSISNARLFRTQSAFSQLELDNEL